jgi:(2Fe-2S) ferredoxin
MWKNKILMTGRDSVKHRLYVGYSGAWYSKVATADVRFIEEEATSGRSAALPVQKEGL